MSEMKQRAREIFEHAIEIADSGQRERFVLTECKKGSELHAEVNRLLQANDEATGLFRSGDGDDKSDFELQPPILEGRDGELTQSLGNSTLEKEDQIIAGRYKLRQNIGEGGMGSVWVAEQFEPVKRKVAIKMIKAGMDSKQVLARFNAERQALALMDHPNIAKVFDGGMTEQGRPYFVMEYVKGIPFTDYCDQARVPLKERLELFIPVCQAIQHAHQKGIVHRDLKPSNILICLYDGKPVPKVIDFGLAKALHQPLTEQSIFTGHGMMVGTPIYMSPEQAELNNLDVDTRTDIYSLGVMLYELLVGSTPLEKAQFKEAAFNEVLRIIKEVEPPRPSTRLSGSTSLPSIAAQRNIDPNQLRKSLAGDLDWIVMKSLEKERTRRYETATELSRDIERFLSDEPVEACPPSRTYRLKKFVRKNRPQVVAAILLFGALLLGVAGTSWGMYVARAAESDANKARQDVELALNQVKSERDQKDAALILEKEQRELAQELSEQNIAKRDALENRIREIDRARSELGQLPYFIMNQILLQSRSESVGGRGAETTIIAAAKFAEAKIAEVKQGSNFLQSRLWLLLGDYWSANQDMKSARRCWKIAIDTWEATLSKEPMPDVTQISGESLMEADAMKSLETLRFSLYMGTDPIHGGRVLNGILYLHELLAEETNLRATLDQHGKQFAENDSTKIIWNHVQLARQYVSEDQSASARKEFEEAIQEIKNDFGAFNLPMLQTIIEYRDVLLDLKQWKEASQWNQRAMDLSCQIHGYFSPTTLNCLSWAVKLSVHHGEKEEALSLNRFLLHLAKETRLRVIDPDYAYDAFVTSQMMCALDKHEDAFLIISEIVEKKGIRNEFESIPAAGDLLAQIGFYLWQQKRFDDAEKIYDWAYRIHVANRGTIDGKSLSTLANRGVNLASAGRVSDAIGLFKKYLDAEGEFKKAWVYFELLDALVSQENQVGVKEIVDPMREAIMSEFSDVPSELASKLTRFGDQLASAELSNMAKFEFETALGIRLETMPNSWLTANTKVLLGRSLLRIKQTDKAAMHLKSGYEELLSRSDSIPVNIRKERMLRPIDLLLSIAVETGDLAAIEKWTEERLIMLSKFDRKK